MRLKDIIKGYKSLQRMKDDAGTAARVAQPVSNDDLTLATEESHIEQKFEPSVGSPWGKGFLVLLLSFGFLLTSVPAQAQDITSGLIGHWTMDDDSGATAVDEISGNDGAMAGGLNAGSDSVPGQIGTALRLNGSSDYINVGDQAVFDFGTSDFSIGMWVKFDNTTTFTGYEELISKGEIGSTDSYYIAKEESGGCRSIDFGLDDGGGVTSGNSPGCTFPWTDTNWHHVLVAYDRDADATLYIDGVLNASEDISGDNGNISSGNDLLIGAVDLGGVGDYLDGDIDDVRIYNRALTASDAATLYAYTGITAGRLRYNRNVRATEYYDGANWVAMGAQRYVPNAVDFDEANDSLWTTTAVGTAGATAWSGSFWIKRKDLGINDVVYDGRTSAGDFKRVDIDFDFSMGLGDKMRFLAQNSADTTILEVHSTAIADTDWHHVMFSFDITNAANSHIYIDNVPAIDSTPTYNTAETFDFSGNRVGVGGSANGGTSGWNLYAGLADFWMDLDTYIDLSLPSNRAKFYDNGPVFFGDDGSLPTGSAPEIFLTGATADWHINKGTGPDFTEVGELSTFATRPGTFVSATLSTMGATLTGTDKWGGGVLGVDGKIYGIPRDSTDILIIDPVAGTATRSAMGADLSGTTKWMDGVAGPDGKIYGIPRDSTDILIIDPVAGTATRSDMGATLTGSNKWEGGALGSDGKIYGIPRNATDILIIDPVAGTATRSTMGATLPGSAGWTDGVTGPDGKIYGIPFNATDILIIDPEAGTATLDDMGATLTGGSKWSDGVLGPDGKIYGITWQATDLLVIDPAAGTATRSALGADVTTIPGGWYEGAVGADGKIYTIPSSNTQILVIDPASGTASTDGFGLGLSAGSTEWEGAAVAANGKIYGIPRQNTNIMIIDTIGACTNPARNEGSIIYNTTSNVMQYCNGEDWIAMGPVPGPGGAGCNNPTRGEGSMMFNTSQGLMQYCDGTDWVSIGKGVVSGPWEPDSLDTGPVLWFDAAEASTINHVAGAVSTWTDKVNGRVASLDGGSGNPSYSTTEFEGTYPGVTFSGSERMLGTLASAAAGDTFGFVVVDHSGTQDGSGYGHAFSLNAGAQAWNNQQSFLLGNQGATTACVFSTSNCMSVGTWSTDGDIIFGGIRSSANERAGAFNGALTLTSDSRTMDLDATTDDFYIGGDAGADNYELIGTIGEIIIFNYEPTLSERQQVEGYLAHKWGLESKLPAGHPYKSAPP